MFYLKTCFLAKLLKETLAVTFLFQCYFLLVVGDYNLVDMFIFIGFFWNSAGSILRYAKAFFLSHQIHTKI